MKNALITLVILTAFGGQALGQNWAHVFSGPNDNGFFTGVTDTGEIVMKNFQSGSMYTGTFGPGPWVDFVLETPYYRIQALKPNGEIWYVPMGSVPNPGLLTTLPDVGPWCGFGGHQGRHAITCAGEIYTIQGGYVGTLDITVNAETSPFGSVKATYR